MANLSRKETRKRLHVRIRNKVAGTAERPRLSVNFSGQHIYAQIIDDEASKTLVAVATTEKDLRGQPTTRSNVKTAETVGKMMAERAKQKKITEVVFDRGGFRYHGKVKALADAARDGGLKF